MRLCPNALIFLRTIVWTLQVDVLSLRRKREAAIKLSWERTTADRLVISIVPSPIPAIVSGVKYAVTEVLPTANAAAPHSSPYNRARTLHTPLRTIIVVAPPQRLRVPVAGEIYHSGDGSGDKSNSGSAAVSPALSLRPTAVLDWSAAGNSPQRIPRRSVQANSGASGVRMPSVTPYITSTVSLPNSPMRPDDVRAAIQFIRSPVKHEHDT